MCGAQPQYKWNGISSLVTGRLRNSTPGLGGWGSVNQALVCCWERNLIRKKLGGELLFLFPRGHPSLPLSLPLQKNLAYNIQKSTLTRLVTSKTAFKCSKSLWKDIPISHYHWVAQASWSWFQAIWVTRVNLKQSRNLSTDLLDCL